MNVNIKTDNAAFWDADCNDPDQECPEHEAATAYECARILEEVAEKLRNGQYSGCVYDVNGNNVGSFSM
jgi:hypothetical protein